MSRFEPTSNDTFERQGAVVGVGGLHVDALLDAVHLLLDRRRHRRLDVGGAGAHEGGGDLDHRGHDLGVLGDRQAGHRHEPQDHGDDGDHHRHDRTVDEEAGHATSPRPPAPRRPSRPGRPRPASGSPTTPSRTFCRPSTTTFSPGFRPSSITQRPSTRGPTLTLRNVDLVVRADHGDAVEVLQLLDGALRARAGRPPSSRPRSARGRTGRGARRGRGWGSVNCTASVPVVGSTARSMASTRPLWGCTVPSARISSISRLRRPGCGPAPATRFARRRYSASLMPGAEQDRVDLRDRREQRALAAPDQVAGLDLRGADEAVDRRSDVRVAEVERRLVDGRLVPRPPGPGPRPGGDGVVQLLLADRLLLRRGAVSA